MQTQAAAQPLDIKNYIAKRSCSHCCHIKVCALFRAVAPLIESWKAEPPIQTEDLAVICNQFLSSQIAKTLSEA
ncbi:MAG: hypothetical protein QXL10_01570 [Candidatus Bathyarchaeia archaeon]